MSPGGTIAVVVCWNGGERIAACVSSLLAQGLAPERVVVVDNASTDGSPELVERELPGVALLRSERNEGFGRGANRGIERALAAGAERVLLLNDDAVLPGGALALLEEALASDPSAGIVGPRVLRADDPSRLWCAGGRMAFRENLSTLLGHGAPDGPEWRRTFEVDYVAGAAMLVRRDVFERVGLLDGEYFAYHEDVELCLKAREAGFRVLTVGEAAALHAAHTSTGGGYNPRRKYMMGVNTVWFLRRHGTPARWLAFLALDVLALPLVWLWRAPRGEGAAVVAKARGIADGLRGKRVEAASVPGPTEHV